MILRGNLSSCFKNMASYNHLLSTKCQQDRILNIWKLLGQVELLVDEWRAIQMNNLA